MENSAVKINSGCFEYIGISILSIVRDLVISHCTKTFPAPVFNQLLLNKMENISPNLIVFLLKETRRKMVSEPIVGSIFILICLSKS
ncbi:hypothetical protein [Rose yellow vein virus]|uniref:Uncharacterized protein n=1 Tax=Rose yellow vein virus TaxID=1213588 RepID=I7CAS1_9VIRU|nr:hypothetical protein [Rose yellow vein virus]AFO54495.1 hypothetical protein [Rose yellow vein virus]